MASRSAQRRASSYARERRILFPSTRNGSSFLADLPEARILRFVSLSSLIHPNPRFCEERPSCAEAPRTEKVSSGRNPVSRVTMAAADSSWAGRMAAAFGASFLWLVCLIYFIQVSSSSRNLTFLAITSNFEHFAIG